MEWSAAVFLIVPAFLVIAMIVTLVVLALKKPQE
jgi:hypothetical protein